LSLGADDVVVVSDENKMKKYIKKLDYLLCCSPGSSNFDQFFKLLNIDGTFCFVGIPNHLIVLNPGLFLFRRISFTGSLVGSPSEIREMLNFCEKNKIHPIIEEFTLSENGVNQCIEKVETNQILFRGVLKNQNFSKL